MSSHLPPVERARAVLLRLDRSAVVGLTVLVVVAVVVAVVLTIHGRPRTVSYTGDGSPVGAVASSSVASSVAPTTDVVVDVVGRVRHPGLVHVRQGARVADVIDAAGGFKRSSDAASVNQARVVSDGEQVVVGPGGGGAGGVGAPAAGGSGSGDAAVVVDLNSATLEQLESLPGVGPVLAQRILEHRTTSGRFGSVDELRDVSGIGDKKFADIAPHVRV